MTVATAVTLTPPTRVAKLTLGALGLAALQDIGIYAAREVTVKAADQALVMRHINNMLDEWNADGANIWRQYRAELPWPGLGAQLTIDGDLVADITDMAERVGSYDRMMQRWETFDFDRIPVKSTTGSPSVFAVYPREDALGVSVWPVPPLDTIFYCTFVRSGLQPHQPDRHYRRATPVAVHGDPRARRAAVRAVSGRGPAVERRSTPNGADAVCSNARRRPAAELFHGRVVRWPIRRRNP